MQFQFSPYKPEPEPIALIIFGQLLSFDPVINQVGY
jgi:hypothetical protein